MVTPCSRIHDANLYAPAVTLANDGFGEVERCGGADDPQPAAVNPAAMAIKAPVRCICRPPI